MREILFKAKRIDDGTWVYGHYQQRYGVNEEKEHLIFWSNTFTSWEYVYIDPETLCQYTGLIDRNGAKIYEGDIIKTSKFGIDDGEGHNFSGFDTFSVKWCDGGFGMENSRRAFYLRDDYCLYEVIGNIFDNPELIERGKMRV